MWFPELTNRISDSHGSEMTICQIIRSKLQERNNPVTNYTLTEVVLDCNVVINNQTYIANMILGLIHFFGFNLLGIITKKIHKNYATGKLLYFFNFRIETYAFRYSFEFRSVSLYRTQ